MVLYFDEETQNDFCREIEKYVEEWSVSYIDAVVTLCESKDIPIEQEGENLNFLPKSSKLPI